MASSDRPYSSFIGRAEPTVRRMASPTLPKVAEGFASTGLDGIEFVNYTDLRPQTIDLSVDSGVPFCGRERKSHAEIPGRTRRLSRGQGGEHSRGFGDLAVRVDALSGRIDALDQKVDRFRVEISARIDALSGRIDGLDQKVSMQFVWLVGIQVAVLLAVIGALLR